MARFKPGVSGSHVGNRVLRDQLRRYLRSIGFLLAIANASCTGVTSEHSQPAPITSLSVTAPTLPDGQVSRAYEAALTATGGTGTYTWSVAAGSNPLPSGLSLVSTSGRISGIPSQPGTYSFTLQVVDNGFSKHAASHAYVVQIAGMTLDQFGGRTDLKCANSTGWFHPEKLGTRWWLCTPEGNAFFANGVDEVLASSAIFQNSAQTHFTVSQWTQATNQRLQSWGFNTLSTGAYRASLPFAISPSFPTDSNGNQSQPVKMPFIASVRPALYAMTNPAISNGSQSARLLNAPVKNMMYALSPFYNSYVPSGGVGDYYDPGIAAWLQKDLQVDAYWTALKNSHYLNYLVGIASDDGDEMYGFGTSPDFQTNPRGHNGANLAMIVATVSPRQTANSKLGWLYADTAVYTKQALREFLVNEYSTISALNAAWGSNYTTFSSSGSRVVGEPIATGDASTTNFSHSFRQGIPSVFSVQILVDGTPVAGDVGDGAAFALNGISAVIDHKNGTLEITFPDGGVPAMGSQITVDYDQNGWGIGTGFMDEDDRSSHQSWMGTDWLAMSTANPNVKADMNAFLEQMSGQYFKTCNDGIKAVFPNTLYFGPASLSSWDIPPPAPVLKAAAQFVDVFMTANVSVFNQTEMDYIEQNWGDKPYLGSFYGEANPDSSLHGHPNTNSSSAFLDQAARGKAYYDNMVQMLQGAHTSTGNYPYIGLHWFEYADSWTEKLNWGLVTQLDNAYDGHEDVAARVSCSPPLAQYNCGGEAADYGDVITSVKAANLLWLGIN